MRIFKVGSKTRKIRKQNSLTSRQQIEPIPSIGSELAASDQFEILVSKKTSAITLNNEHRRKNKGSILGYFGSDNDDSTVSSITTVEYGGFFYSRKPYYYNPSSAAKSLSSLCCCGESDNTTTGTHRTNPSSTDNTLIQNSAYGTIQPTDSRSQYRSMSGSRCCGPDYSVSPTGRRSFLFSGYWGRSRIGNNNKQVPNMSASLFDNLSDDEMDIDMKRSGSFSGSRQNHHKPVSLRRVLTWKRRALF
jgi:hypothetical protein